jgi:hypothetical protein
MRVHLNLWLFRGNAPDPDEDVEVIFAGSFICLRCVIRHLSTQKRFLCPKLRFIQRNRLIFRPDYALFIIIGWKIQALVVESPDESFFPRWPFVAGN